jgi:hypothetical protein
MQSRFAKIILQKLSTRGAGCAALPSLSFAGLPILHVIEVHILFIQQLHVNQRAGISVTRWNLIGKFMAAILAFDDSAGGQCYLGAENGKMFSSPAPVTINGIRESRTSHKTQNKNQNQTPHGTPTPVEQHPNFKT